MLAGAVIAGAAPSTLTQLAAFSEPLGLAFQITDDILELTRSAADLGKPVGSDLKHDKVTYPAAVGLEEARRAASQLSLDAKAALVDYDGDSSLLLSLADFVVGRDR